MCGVALASCGEKTVLTCGPEIAVPWSAALKQGSVRVRESMRFRRGERRSIGETNLVQAITWPERSRASSLWSELHWLRQRLGDLPTTKSKISGFRVSEIHMEKRGTKPRWGWLFIAILLFWGVLVLRASTEDFWARVLLLVWGLIIVALCFLKSNEPR